MLRRNFIFVLLLVAIPIVANSGNEVNNTSISLGWFLVLVGGISFVVVAFLIFLQRMQSEPGTLPIKKLAIVAVLTILANAIFFGINYVEV